MESSASEKKKLVKPNKLLFGPTLHKTEVIMGHSQREKQFLAETTKACHRLSAGGQGRREAQSTPPHPLQFHWHSLVVLAGNTNFSHFDP